MSKTAQINNSLSYGSGDEEAPQGARAMQPCDAYQMFVLVAAIASIRLTDQSEHSSSNNAAAHRMTR
eukprot:scaffold121908_cov42-Prasinocladus_malaysianus.AAC.1